MEDSWLEVNLMNSYKMKHTLMISTQKTAH